MSARAADAARAPEKEITVALLGRPNAGKSSLYNAVTGGDAKVGNFPGITVDVLESHAPLPTGGRARFLDLPGVYSLGDDVDVDSDEGQARACLDRLESRREKTGEPFIIAQVIDATQLVLSLRLTQEILARRATVIVLVTQRDVLERSGGALDASVLEQELGVPVIAVSARDSDVRARVLEAVSTAQGSSATRAIDPRELAARAITRKRREGAATSRADAILLHPILGPMIFVAIMTALFSAVFLVADPASNALDAIISRVSKAITGAFGTHWWTSLVCDGILGGAGTVLAFLPQIVVLTIALEIIDASGYLARGAFLVDRVLRLAGLGGKSFVPLLTAHACAVPAITATRIVRDPKQRLANAPRASAHDVLGAHPDVRAPHRRVLSSSQRALSSRRVRMLVFCRYSGRVFRVDRDRKDDRETRSAPVASSRPRDARVSCAAGARRRAHGVALVHTILARGRHGDRPRVGGALAPAQDPDARRAE